MRSPNPTARPPQSALRQPEPTLDELLDEPIIQLVMQRDGIRPADLRLDFEQFRANLA
jgi:hypothetical protein